MGLTIKQITDAAPKDFLRTVRSHAAESLKNIPDGLFDFLREKIPELKTLSDSSFAVLMILKSEGKFNKESIQKALNKGKIPTNDKLVDKVNRLFSPLILDFKKGGKGDILPLDLLLPSISSVAQVKELSVVSPLTDEQKVIRMIDKLIEEYTNDPKEADRDTLAQIQAFKKYFTSPIAEKRPQLVVPNTHELSSTASFVYVPAGFYFRIADQESGGTVVEMFPVLQSDFVREHWESFDDKLVRVNFAASIVKEGIYLLTADNTPEVIKGPYFLEKDFIEKFKQIKFRSQDTADQQYAMLASNRDVVEAAKRFIAAKVHLEYIGFKNKLEFFGRQIQGVNVNPELVTYLQPTIAHHLTVNLEKTSFLNDRFEINNEDDYKLSMAHEFYAVTQDTSIARVALRIILKDHELQKNSGDPFVFVNDKQYFTGSTK